MSHWSAIIGLQWGDEGKGKIVDAFSDQLDWIIRYQGGANAGHTLVVGSHRYVFHLLPSGLLHPHVRGLLGPGMVIDPEAFWQEIQQFGPDQLKDRVWIHPKATIVLPIHRLLDQAREQGGKGIGSTQRGIGPAYEDRIGRKALLFADFWSPEPQVKERLKGILGEKNWILKGLGLSPFHEDQLWDWWQLWRDRLARWIIPSDQMSDFEAQWKNQRVLLEGAQGILLDIWQGTYPYVTSSSPVPEFAFLSGLPRVPLSSVLGVFKSYVTRVGLGPLPSQMDPQTENYVVEKGREFGSTTGRRRRVGWLDLPALKWAIRTSGTTGLVLTKADVLAGLPQVGVVVGYRKGSRFIEDGLDLDWQDPGEPIIQWFEGWDSIQNPKSWPLAFGRFLGFLQDHLPVPIRWVSFGPERHQWISL